MLRSTSSDVTVDDRMARIAKGVRSQFAPAVRYRPPREEHGLLGFHL
jgi:hypothetical protein